MNKEYLRNMLYDKLMRELSEYSSRDNSLHNLIKAKETIVYLLETHDPIINNTCYINIKKQNHD